MNDGPRHRGRRAAISMLYQADLSGDGSESVIRAYFGGLAQEELEEDARRFAEHLFRGTRVRRDEIDTLIRAGSEHWRLERMSAIDRNVLRLALFELLDDPSTPHAVILDQAVVLAKDFGGEESGAFVNGVADGIRRRIESGELKR